MARVSLQEVLDVLHTAGAGCVAAYFAGHAHKGGYTVDSHGIHHRTLESPLECELGVVAFGTLSAYDNPKTLVLSGEGRVPRTLVMPIH